MHADVHEVSAVGGPSQWESGSTGTSTAPTTSYLHDEWEVYTHVAADSGDHGLAPGSASGSLQHPAESGSHSSTTNVAHGQQRHDDGGTEHTGDVEIEDSLASMLSMVLGGYLVCAALEYLNQIVPSHMRVQLSCVIFLAGGLIFFIVEAIPAEGHDFEVLLAGHNSLAYLNPHALFYVILPPLLYESASGTPWHVLRKVLASSVILAFPGVVVNTALTAVMAKPILTDFRDRTVSWEILFLLSSILSATDPVAVLAALRTLGAPPKLSSLIEGESLLNDGSAYVVFLVFNDLASASAPAEEKMCATEPAGCVTWNFLRLAAGGSLLGVGIGLVVTMWIQRARFVNSAALEVTIVLIGVYGSFFVAERLECSGVLAVVVFGITSSAMLVSKLSNEASHAHHKVVSLLGYICDKIIFFAAGMICARFLSVPIRCAGEVSGQLVASMFGRIFALYVILHIARIIMVIVFAPLLTKLGYGCTWREGCMLVFAGLRGALALCMGLVVLHNQYISRGDANAVGFYTSGIVFLTLILNGSLVDPFFKWLNLYPPNQHRIGRLTRQLNKVEAQLQHGLFRKLYSHWFFKDCRFESILQCVPNLSKVDFEPETGRPISTSVISTRRTLNDLETLAANYRNDILSQQQARYEMDFQTEWRARHGALTQDVIAWLIETSSAPSLVEPTSGDLLPTTDLPQRPISSDTFGTLTSGSSCSTAVSASFTPGLRQGADQMHEIYMTLFKAVLWQYRKRHEHGIIGDWALSWLVEAANEAMDCANHETNARRILDFADKSHWRGSLRATRELQDALDRKPATGPPSGGAAAADPVAVTAGLTALGRAALAAGDRPKPGLYEPLIVQYLIIEEMCSKSSPTERYPRAWRGAKFVRSFGYNRTRARVECLYAYIEALEKAVHKFKELAHFPGIYLLLQRLIDAAKKDMDIIMVLNPRQFFFCKHTLALKIVLSKRLHKLEEEAEQGWIAPADAEGLVHDTRTRLAKVELHVPNLRTSWLFRSIERHLPSLQKSSPKELQENVQESWRGVITELFRDDAARAAGRGFASGPGGAHAERGGAGTELGTKVSDGDHQAFEPAKEPPVPPRWRDRAKTGRGIVPGTLRCCSRFRVLSFLF